MDNLPSEGEDKQTTPSRPYDLISIPVPSTNATVQTSSDVSPDRVPSSTTDQQHTNHAGTLILQWLTYAFWGWTVLALSALTISVFLRLVAGQDTSTFNYYVISALIVLLPISFACDIFYSKKEPDKKIGPSSLVMVVHAVIFALFTIGSLLFAAWSIVAVATNTTDRSTMVADLCAALLLSLFYGATFMRTLNPSHIRWIPKVFRYTMLGFVILFIIIGFIKPTFRSEPKLEPSVVGGTQCDLNTLSDGSSYAQVAISGGATCTDAESVIQGVSGKNGKGYVSNGYDCTSIKQGSGTQWSSYWNNNFYSYSCTNGSKGVAFNWQAAQATTPLPESPTTPSNNIGPNGKLEPSVVGGTQCDIPTLSDGSTTGQVALDGGATCNEAEANIQSATGKNGGNYSGNGYSCTSTKQGANTQWSSYWNNAFYSYNCTSGSKQVAFNLQTTAQNQTTNTLTN